MVAEQAFLAPRSALDPNAVAAATMAVAAAGEIGGVAIRTFADRQRQRRADRLASNQEARTAPTTPIRQPDFASPIEAPAASSVPQCNITPLMTPEAQPQYREATTVEREYKILAEWKRGVKLRSANDEAPSLDKVIKEHIIEGIRPESHTHESQQRSPDTLLCSKMHL